MSQFFVEITSPFSVSGQTEWLLGEIEWRGQDVLVRARPFSRLVTPLTICAARQVVVGESAHREGEGGGSIMGWERGAVVWPDPRDEAGKPEDQLTPDPAGEQSEENVVSYPVWGQTPEQFLKQIRFCLSDIGVAVASEGQRGVYDPGDDWYPYAPSASLYEGRLYSPQTGGQELARAIEQMRKALADPDARRYTERYQSVMARFALRKQATPLQIARLARKAGILTWVLAFARQALVQRRLFAKAQAGANESLRGGAALRERVERADLPLGYYPRWDEKLDDTVDRGTVSWWRIEEVNDLDPVWFRLSGGTAGSSTPHWTERYDTWAEARAAAEKIAPLKDWSSDHYMASV